MHVPVLLKQTLNYLNVLTNHKFVDATVGDGGHLFAILDANPQAKVLGIDLDQTSLDNLQKTVVQKGLSQNVKLVSENYKNIDKIISHSGFDRVDGILVDLGLSSTQLDDPSRGLSFQQSGPLDMRFNRNEILTAEEVVNRYSEKDLARIIHYFGEDRFYRQIARSIVEERKKSPLISTLQLAKLVPHPDGRRRLFQALRIEVNHELDNLKEFLPKALQVLSSGGRLVVISFHSLEDRIVKNFFKESGQKILTKKVVTAEREEIIINPRSKSAKLRALEKI